MATRRGPDNSVRVSVQGTLNGVNWANVFRAQLTTSSTITQTDLDTWTGQFQTNYKSQLGPRQSTSVLYSVCKVVLYTPGGGVLSSVATMTGAGTEAGTALPNDATAKVISWLSTVYWRGGKPRTYLAGAVTADVTNNVSLTGTEISALQSAANAFRGAINALTAGTITGTSLGFVSFRSGNADRGTPLFFPITGSRVHPRLGTQRRRLGKWTN